MNEFRINFDNSTGNIVNKIFNIDICTKCCLVKGTVRDPYDNRYPYAAVEIIEYNQENETYTNLGVAFCNKDGEYGFLLEINTELKYYINVYNAL